MLVSYRRWLACVILFRTLCVALWRALGRANGIKRHVTQSAKGP